MGHDAVMMMMIIIIIGNQSIIWRPPLKQWVLYFDCSTAADPDAGGQTSITQTMDNFNDSTQT
jgi:hypothetical protein